MRRFAAHPGRQHGEQTALSARHERDRSASTLPRGVLRAIQFMRENLKARLSIGAVAIASGLSERSLRRQFRCFSGQSPAAFHRGLRLEARETCCAPALPQQTSRPRRRSMVSVTLGISQRDIGSILVNPRPKRDAPPHSP